MTTNERFERLRPLTPRTVSDRRLRERIRRGDSDRMCTRESLTPSQVAQVAGKRRHEQMRARGEYILHFKDPFIPDEESRRSPTGTLPKRDDYDLFDGDEPLF